MYIALLRTPSLRLGSDFSLQCLLNVLFESSYGLIIQLCLLGAHLDAVGIAREDDFLRGQRVQPGDGLQLHEDIRRKRRLPRDREDRIEVIVTVSHCCVAVVGMRCRALEGSQQQSGETRAVKIDAPGSR